MALRYEFANLKCYTEASFQAGAGFFSKDTIHVPKQSVACVQDEGLVPQCCFMLTRRVSQHCKEVHASCTHCMRGCRHNLPTRVLTGYSIIGLLYRLPE